MSRVAAALSPDLVLRPMRSDASDLELFAACFAKNSSPRTRAALEWQYLKNPTGEVFVDFAVAPEDKLAAIYATLPVRLRVGGELVLGMQSVDTITDADFRGRGLFLTLAKETYRRAAVANAQLVYGFPNGNSAHGFFERLGWTNLDPVPFLIRPLRSTYVLQRLRAGRLADKVPAITLFRRTTKAPPRGQLVRLERLDDRATRLWHAFAEGVGVAVERDDRYLNWRIVEKPGESYLTHAIVEGDELRALVCHVVKSKHGGRIGYVMEAMCLPGCEADLRFLLRHALGMMVDDGADVALAWCLSHSRPYGSYVRSGFLPFPRKLWPIELHLGACAFHPTASRATARHEWYLSYLDSDTT